MIDHTGDPPPCTGPALYWQPKQPVKDLTSFVVASPFGRTRFAKRMPQVKRKML
jgi:hypothetical protein